MPALRPCRCPPPRCSIKPFTVTERKARAATRNQPWGPTGAELGMLAELTHSPADCDTVLRVLDLRLAYPPHKWRNVYKVMCWGPIKDIACCSGCIRAGKGCRT